MLIVYALCKQVKYQNDYIEEYDMTNWRDPAKYWTEWDQDFVELPGQ